MFHHATFRARGLPDVSGPFPAGFIGGTPDRQAGDSHQFKLPFLKSAYLIRLFKTLENDFVQSSLRGLDGYKAILSDGRLRDGRDARRYIEAAHLAS